MTGNENQDASSKKRLKTCDNDGPTTWSDLNHDLLFSVMMQLGVVDFPAFSGVCKSGRSFALSNRNKFMASKPRMSLSLSLNANSEYICHLKDPEGKGFKIILPHSASRTYVGFTCGYVAFFCCETNDFWLVNPIIRDELHFPANPILDSNYPERIRGILVFSPVMSGWVYVMTDRSTNIWFSLAGQETWKHVTSTSPIVDLHAFKGKIYTIISDGHLSELRLNPEPKLTILETKNVRSFLSGVIDFM